jgi:hypothetical protein
MFKEKRTTPLHLAVDMFNKGETGSRIRRPVAGDEARQRRIGHPAFSVYNTIRHLINKNPEALRYNDYTDGKFLTPYQVRVGELRGRLKEKPDDIVNDGAAESEQEFERRLREAVAKDPLANFIRTYCIRHFSLEHIRRALYTLDQGSWPRNTSSFKSDIRQPRRLR